MAPDLMGGNKKPNSYRDGYPGNKNDAGSLSRSPSHQRLSAKNDKQLKGFSPQKKGSLGQRQGSAEPHNVLALPSPFDNSAMNSKLPPHPLPGNHRRQNRNLKGSYPGGANAPMLEPNAHKNKKYNNTEDLNSQYSFVSAGQQANSPHGPGSHMKNQSLLRAQQLQQMQSNQNSKQKMVSTRSGSSDI